MKIIRCPYCQRVINSPKSEKRSYTPDESEILQNECLKLRRRIEKLQYKHDFEDLPSWKLNDVNNQLSVLKRMLEVLEEEI